MTIEYTRPAVVRATCDRCDAELLDDGNPNHGLLRSCFGWPSDLDNLSEKVEIHLCRQCWEACLRALDMWDITYPWHKKRKQPDAEHS